MNYKEHCMTGETSDAVFVDFLYDEKMSFYEKLLISTNFVSK